MNKQDIIDLLSAEGLRKEELAETIMSYVSSSFPEPESIVPMNEDLIEAFIIRNISLSSRKDLDMHISLFKSFQQILIPEPSESGMSVVPIYKFQLRSIEDTLGITANIHDSHKKVTCHDRMVISSRQYALNALDGVASKRVPYV